MAVSMARRLREKVKAIPACGGTSVEKSGPCPNIVG